MLHEAQSKCGKCARKKKNLIKAQQGRIVLSGREKKIKHGRVSARKKKNLRHSRVSVREKKFKAQQGKCMRKK